MDSKSEIEEMIDWINANDVFWLQDFKKQFNIIDEGLNRKRSGNHRIAQSLINELKKSNQIQCSEKKGTQRQYIVIKKIEFKFVLTGKGPGYHPY